MLKRSSLFLSFFLVALAFTACSSSSKNTFRYQTAKRLASPAYMVERSIAANQFLLTAFERVHDRGGVAHVYIEGDGAIKGDSGSFFSGDTPSNPVGLHLATRDKASNLIYISRPCQYSGKDYADEDCDGEFMKNARYSRTVIDAYNAALDNVKNFYGFSAFHIVGTDGGAAIATILASQRNDIHSLRTVAGVMNTDLANIRNAEGPLTDSLNPVDFASKLSRMPQFHAIGGQDVETPPKVLHSYLSALGVTNCVSTQFVQEASHDKGWVDKWPELLARPVQCRGRMSRPSDTFVDETLIRREELSGSENAPVSILN